MTTAPLSVPAAILNDVLDSEGFSPSTPGKCGLVSSFVWNTLSSKHLHWSAISAILHCTARSLCYATLVNV